MALCATSFAGDVTSDPAGQGIAHDAAQLLREGREHLSAGRLEAARVRLSEALRLQPRDLEGRAAMADCAAALGEAALDRGEVEAAISHFQTSLELAPFHPAADAGLRRAAARSSEDAPSDPLMLAIDSLPPVKALRDLQVAERTVARLTRTPPASTLLRQRIDSREAELAALGRPSREQRVEKELAAAWGRRWLYRSLPAVAIGASALLGLLLSAPGLLMWGLVLALFAGAWDVIFVEQGRELPRA